MGRARSLRLRHHAEAALWLAVLRQTQARLVIAIQPTIGLCRASHQAGIHVYDLQHGLIDMRGYYTPPAQTGLPPEDRPSGYLAWDEPSAVKLMSMNSNAPVFVTGHPWYARFLRRDPHDILVNEAIAAWPKRKHDLPQVVVTLQHGIDELAPEYAPNGVMAEALVEAIRLSADRFAWQLRLHPSQTVGPDAIRIERFLKSNFEDCATVEWRVASRTPLPLLLANAAAHITHFSATTREAGWLGVRTGLLDPHFVSGGKRDDVLEFERRKGLAEVLPFEPSAIVRFLERVASEAPHRVRFGGAVDRMEMFLRHVESHTHAGLHSGRIARKP